MRPPLVLLPGLHGTAALFKRFIAAAPRHVTTTAVPLPHESLSYPELAVRIAADLPNESSVIVAESFSGPLAVALTPLRRVEALILCNTFVTAPAFRALRWLVNPMMFRRPMPEYLLRRYLLDQSVDVALVREVAAAIASVPAELLASRLRVLLEANEADTFARCIFQTLTAWYRRSNRPQLGVAEDGGAASHDDGTAAGTASSVTGESRRSLEGDHAVSRGKLPLEQSSSARQNVDVLVYYEPPS